MATLSLLPQLPPQLLQVGQALTDDVGIGGLVLQEALTALQDVVYTRLMALDLLLQSLRRERTSSGQDEADCLTSEK